MVSNVSLNNFVAHSSLQYLAKHMYIVYSATQVLMDFFSDVLYENWVAAEAKREVIKELTYNAQALLQAVGTRLSKERFVTINRTDIISLLQMQTRIANKSQAITGLVIGRQLKLPPAVGVEYFSMLNQSIMAIQQTYLLINHLSDLHGSAGKEQVKTQLTLMIDQLDILENVTDQLQIQARKALFALEPELSPVDVITLYKLLEWTGDLADRAHEVGGRLISILSN